MCWEFHQYTSGRKATTLRKREVGCEGKWKHRRRCRLFQQVQHRLLSEGFSLGKVWEDWEIGRFWNIKGGDYIVRLWLTPQNGFEGRKRDRRRRRKRRGWRRGGERTGEEGTESNRKERRGESRGGRERRRRRKEKMERQFLGQWEDFCEHIRWWRVSRSPRCSLWDS